MYRHALDFEGFLKSHPKEAIKVEPIPGRGYKVVLTANWGGRGEIDILNEFGFNVSKVVFLNDGDKEPIQIKEATWEKAGELWYVKSALDQRDFRNVGIPLKQWRFNLTEFEANCKVPNKWFNLEALEMPPGTRILDLRSNRKEKEYYYGVGPKDPNKKLDEILAQAEALPTTRTKQGMPPRNLTPWLLLIGLFLLGGIIALLYVLRKPKNMAKRT